MQHVVRSPISNLPPPYQGGHVSSGRHVRGACRYIYIYIYIRGDMLVLVHMLGVHADIDQGGHPTSGTGTQVRGTC